MLKRVYVCQIVRVGNLSSFMNACIAGMSLHINQFIVNQFQDLTKKLKFACKQKGLLFKSIS